MRISVARGQTPYRIPWAAAATGAALLLLGLVAALATTQTQGPVTCPFRAVTGLPCPTCGLTRCAGLIMTGRLGEAMRLNPFDAFSILVAAPAALVMLILNRTLGLCVRIETSRGERTAFWAALAVVLAANWVYVLSTHPH